MGVDWPSEARTSLLGCLKRQAIATRCCLLAEQAQELLLLEHPRTVNCVRSSNFWVRAGFNETEATTVSV